MTPTSTLYINEDPGLWGGVTKQKPFPTKNLQAQLNLPKLCGSVLWSNKTNSKCIMIPKGILHCKSHNQEQHTHSVARWWQYHALCLTLTRSGTFIPKRRES